MKKNKKLPKYTEGGSNPKQNFDPSASMGWYQYAKGASDMGRSAISRDETGMATTSEGRVMDANMTASHELAMQDFKKGNTAAGVADLLGGGKLARVASYGLNKENETTGFWGKTNKIMGFGAYDKSKQVDNSAEIEANKNEMLNKLQYGTFRQGGVSYPTNAIPIHGGNWAIPTFNSGGRMYNPNVGIPNAEIEKQEVVNHPSGGVQSFDLNSHENATSANQINLEGGAKILSDKIKNPLTKKPFAQEAKRFDTSKEEKILNDSKATKSAKKTAELNFMTKKALFNKTFEQQEAIKMEKAAKYLGKLGIYANGGYQPLNNPYKKLDFIPSFQMGGPQEPQLKATTTPTNNPVPTGYNLMANVKLNQDPSMIPEGVNIGGYNQFQKFLSSKDFVKDPRMNTNEGRKLYTDELINEFNTSDYIKKYPQNKITPESIKAIQEYHKKSDPNVVVDGWVGSQTSQMRYPTPSLSYQSKSATDKAPAYMDKPINVTWGNKQYTLPADKWNNYSTKDFVPVNRYGGVQKFKNGGKKYADSVKFEPRIAEDTGDYPIVPGTYTGYGEPVTEAIDPRFIQKNPLNDTQAELLVNSAKAYKPEQPTQDTPKESNWKNNAFQAGMLLANSAGPIAYLAGEGKKYDKQNLYTYNPEILDPTASLRDADMAAKAAAYDLANRSSGNAGNYLTNRVALAGLTSLNKDKIRREFGNINAQIKNQGQLTNIQNKYMTDDINAKNKGKALTNYYKAIGQLGTNTAQAGRDYKSYQTDDQQLKMMNDFFQNYYYDKSSNSWKFKSK